jgi:flagellar protein FlbT
MSLKISLAPGESVVIGKAKVENGGDRRCTLIVTGEEAVLRGRRVMREQDATTPMKRLYFVVQAIYLTDDKSLLTPLLMDVLREAVQSWPESAAQAVMVGELVGEEKYYEALSKAYELVELEAGRNANPTDKG